MMSIAYALTSAVVGASVFFFAVVSGMGAFASAALALLSGSLASGVLGILVLALSDRDQNERRF